MLDNKCDPTKLKWCPSLNLTFNQQFACIKQFGNKKIVCMNMVSLNESGSVALQPELVNIDKDMGEAARVAAEEENKQRLSKFKREDLQEGNIPVIFVRGKYVMLHCPDYCPFCGASLKFPKEDVNIQQQHK